jgi:hypothetical protein
VSTANVFVVQEPAIVPRRTGGSRYEIDLTPAKAYGEMRFLLEWSETRDMDPTAMFDLLMRRCADYTEDDWLLMRGNPTAMGLAFLCCAVAAKGKVNLLYWEREARQYTEVKLDLQHMVHVAQEADPEAIPEDVNPLPVALRRQARR